MTVIVSTGHEADLTVIFPRCGRFSSHAPEYSTRYIQLSHYLNMQYQILPPHIDKLQYISLMVIIATVTIIVSTIITKSIVCYHRPT